MYKSLLLLVVVLIQNCSNSNNLNKNSKGNFLAYYNTFYISEKYYSQALDIIKSNQSSVVTAEADILLNNAIENALIIEQDFYNSKYLDDSYYILGMSSFYKNNITSSEYYFNRILSEHKQSEYYNSSMIMIGYLYLKMNKINDLEKLISRINNEKVLNDNDSYLFFLLLADYNKYYNNNEKIKSNYLYALDKSSNNNDKINVYYKLIELAEMNKQYADAVLYIDEIRNLLDHQRINSELLDKWIEYCIKIQDYEKPSKVLRDYIKIENSLKIKLGYEVELANLLIYQKKYSESKQLLNDIILQYSSNSILKKDLDKAYFLLGNIYLESDWDFDESKNSYQSSINASNNSLFSKKSEDKIDALTTYLNYKEEIFYLNTLDGNSELENNNDDLLSGYQDNEFSNLDSLIFHSGQILYFDLGMKDSAMHKFKNIVNNFPKSKYYYKSLLILNIEDPDSMWQEIINDKYSDVLDEIEVSEIDSLIDKAWDLLSISYIDAINSFLDIYENYNSQKSLYSVAFIYDDYVKDMENAIFYYKLYLDKFEEGSFYYEVGDRLNELENMVNFRFKFYDQKINLRKGLRWFENDFNIDSSLYYINLASLGIDSKIKVYCNNISQSIKSFKLDIGLLQNNLINTDSIKLSIAHTLYKDLSFDDLASQYYKEIINSTDKNNYINESYASLTFIEHTSNWDSLLYANVKDSNLYYILINNAERKFEYNLSNSFELDSLDFVWFSKIKQKYFPIIEENNSKIE